MDGKRQYEQNVHLSKDQIKTAKKKKKKKKKQQYKNTTIMTNRIHVKQQKWC